MVFNDYLDQWLSFLTFMIIDVGDMGNSRFNNNIWG